VASGAVAAEAGDTDGMNFILGLFQRPFSLLAAHPLKGLCALLGVVKRAAFRTSNSSTFRRSCTPEKEKRDKAQYQNKTHPFFHRS
jgi:hypothetical protein